MIAVGLMSGTSLDGIDAVRIAVRPRADGYDVETQAFVTLPFEAELRRRILAAYPPGPLDALGLSALHADVGEAFAQAALAAGAGGADYIASHGLTLAHDGAIQAYLPGRTERVSGERGPAVYVDFGHSPDAFEKTLAAVRRVTRGASEAATDRVHALSFDALTASRTVDDAVRHFLSESSGATELRAPVVRAANQTIRLRAAADLIADVVPPPLTPYRAARAVLEEHTAAICARISGTEDRNTAELAPISDDFVLALRAEAEGGTLSVEAALPLVTVAASLGELELLYPDASPA